MIAMAIKAERRILTLSMGGNLAGTRLGQGSHIKEVACEAQRLLQSQGGMRKRPTTNSGYFS